VLNGVLRVLETGDGVASFRRSIFHAEHDANTQPRSNARKFQ
jgi:hypothetical protein